MESTVFGSLFAVYYADFVYILLLLFGAAIFSRAVHSTFIQIVQDKILMSTLFGRYNCQRPLKLANLKLLVNFAKVSTH